MQLVLFLPAIYFPTENLLSVLFDSSSFTSLTISWELDQNLTATAYTISYSATEIDCFTGSSTVTGIAGSETMYTLTGLEEGTEYFITVTATITGGGTRHYTVHGTTEASGETTSFIPLPPQL